MHGIMKTITIPFKKPSGVVKDVRSDSQIIFEGSTTLNRRDYGVAARNWEGIKEGITAVSDEVLIELTVLAKRINATNFKNWIHDPNMPEAKIYEIAKKDGAEKATREFEGMLAEPGNKISVWTMNTSGYMLLRENRAKDALILFRSNLKAFPGSPIGYEACAEALATLEQWPEAIQYYKLALEKDPENTTPKEVLRHIQ